MHSPISATPESGQINHYANKAHSESYSTSEESYHSQTETREDGTTVTRVEYSSYRSSYTVSLSSGDSSQFTGEGLTYSNVSQHYQLSSLSTAPSEEPEDDDVVAEQSSTTQSLSSSSSVAAVGGEHPLLDGAANILHFVEQRIADEKANGASEAELAELWEQGLKGFVEGFNEAYGILEESGQLSDEVEGSIETLSTQVYAGFDAIYDQYIGSRGEDSSASQAVAEQGDKPVNPAPLFAPTADNGAAGGRQTFSSNPVNNQGGSSLGEQFRALGNGSRSGLGELISSLGDIDATVEYGRKDTFSFELTTLDGDTISINASNTASFYGEYDGGAEAGDSLEGMSDKNNFVMNIEGELDDDERAAIADLLDQIMSLADEFYNGDIDKAYEAAMELGYDQNEIASYAVNLRQTEQYNVAAAYQAQEPAVSAEAKDAFAAVGDFAQSVLETLNNPENYAFFDYTQLLRGISEQIDQQIVPTSQQNFSNAVEQLVDTANQVETDDRGDDEAA